MARIRAQGIRRRTDRCKAGLLAALGAAGERYADVRARAGDVHASAAPLRLAFAGEYTVGKSTLISAITGLDIETGAGVTTTDVTEYPHDDLVLVDMPGTLSGNAEHEVVARKAIAEADLLLFVVSNELFNEASLPYFRMAADEMGKREQMLLIVNKLDRFNARDRTVDEAADIIAGTVGEEIAPFPIEPFGPIVVSAKDFLRSVKEADVERQVQLHARSRIDVLFEGINAFVDRRRLLAQHARPLQQLLRLIADATDVALADDPEREHLEAYLRRRQHALEEARASASADLATVRTDIRQKASKPADRVLRAIEKKATAEELEMEWETAGEAFELVARDAGDALAQAVARWEADLRARLEEVDESPVGSRVVLDFKSPVQPGKAPAAPSSTSARVRSKVADVIGKGGARIAKDPAVAREAVAAVYRFFGGRFRPWGKVKLGRTLGKVGKALGPIAVGVESYLAYREEKAKEEAARHLKEFRAQVRTQFHSARTQLDDSVREGGERVLAALFDEPIAEVGETRRELLDAESASKLLLQQLKELDREVRMALADLVA